MTKLAQTITKAQLIKELEGYTDDAPILVSVGKKSYPINCVLSGSTVDEADEFFYAVFLETPIEIGRPEKYPSEEERHKARLEQWRKANAKRKK
jgi:hypothetical protein